MFEVGKIYRTSEGFLVKIIYVCKNSKNIIAITDEERVIGFNERGLAIGNGVRLLDEYKEPVKYTVEIYLPGIPKANPRSNLIGGHILSYGAFSPHRTEDFNHRIRVTVEEIYEG